MTKLIKLLLSILCLNALHALAQEATQINIASSISKHNFSWSIAGNAEGRNPNVLSELKYQDIISLGFKVNGKYAILPRTSVILSIENAQTISGSGTDIDYLEDNRTSPTYVLDFNSSKGGMQQLQAGLAYTLYRHPLFALDVSASYLNTSQSFSMTSPSVENLDTWYTTRQQGVQFGSSLHANLGKKTLATAVLSYSLLDYTGIGNWNLIPTFEQPISFIQESNGAHYGASLGVIRQISSLLSLSIAGGYVKQQVNTGLDRTFLRNGIRQVTRFNGARNSFWQITTGICSSF
ncbi:hypothetical protein [Sphingobacterium deserti]|uniref:Protochlamydia outer membrane protein domain-containing protein n=1 Tax=Sphingobacterium deserti TaxID=1229276 RepID=A0A0B8T4S4_9SPHI|nr:hypothetical protein [Sphingobacterium deserti]KGE15183.1 hypothetical protein DI53_1048 [Sphingobacterium deserti]